MHIPAFAENTNGIRTAFNQQIQPSILIHGMAGAGSGTECHQLAVVPVAFSHLFEKDIIFGAGTGPAALNPVDAEISQPLGNTNFVFDRKTDTGGLCTITQGCVE